MRMDQALAGAFGNLIRSSIGYRLRSSDPKVVEMAKEDLREIKNLIQGMQDENLEREAIQIEGSGGVDEKR